MSNAIDNKPADACCHRAVATLLWLSLFKTAENTDPSPFVAIQAAMEQRLSLTDLSRRAADYVARVFHRRERFVVERDGEPMAELRPLPPSRSLGELPGLLASLPHLSQEEVTRFADDLDEARNELATRAPRDPWVS